MQKRLVDTSLGIITWDDVQKVLARFPWVNAIHDTGGQRLWCSSNKVHSIGAMGQN
jgi:hypothetical protein